MQKELYREPQPVVQTESSDQSEKLPRIDRWLKQGIENNGGVRNIAIDQLYWDIQECLRKKVEVISFRIEDLYPAFHEILEEIRAHNAWEQDDRIPPTLETVFGYMQSYIAVDPHDIPSISWNCEQERVNNTRRSMDQLVSFYKRTNLSDEERRKEYHSRPIFPQELSQ